MAGQLSGHLTTQAGDLRSQPRGPVAQRPQDGGQVLLPAVTLGAALLVVLLGRVGGDARWVGALGRLVAASGHVPTGVPYASAPSTGWHNVPVLAELLLALPQGAAGDRGLLLVQALAVPAAVGLLLRDARLRGARPGAAASALVIVLIGCCTSVLVVRLQLFSLVLFPAELLLLRRQSRRPSAQLWLLPPLLALWSNLHGAALMGFAVAASYLLLERRRTHPVQAAAVLLSSAGALCLTPALLHTPRYYLGVLGNESARQHLGLWAHPSLASPFDALLLLSIAALVPAVLLNRPRPWEVAALLGLAAMTLLAGRNGVWLLFALLAPAAAGWPHRRAGFLPDPGQPAADSRRLPLWGSLLLLLLAPTGFAWRSVPTNTWLVAAAIHLADGRPVAAEGVLSEQVVAGGGRVWMSNPLDAFPAQDQQRFLRWSSTGELGLLPRDIGVVLVDHGSPAARAVAADPVFRCAFSSAEGEVYLRRPVG